LDETYERIFLAIRDEDYKLVHTALSLLYITSSRGETIRTGPLLGLLHPVSDEPEADVTYQNHALAHLRRVCGCLLTISFDYAFDTEIVEVAHYTVKEFLLSDRMAHGPVSRFALSVTHAKREHCRRVLLVACEPREWDESYPRDLTEPGPYCVKAILKGLLRDYEDEAIHVEELQNVYIQLLDPSRPSWERLKFVRRGGDKFMPISIPYTEPPENSDAVTVANLLSTNCFSLAESFLRSRNVNQILYRTLIHTKAPSGAAQSSNVMDFYREWHTDEAGFGESFYYKIVKIAADLSGPTAALCIYLGYHEHLDEDHHSGGYYSGQGKCRIRRFLECGADRDGAGYRLTPLQIAVYRLDLSAVNELIHNSANVDGIGFENGEAILPESFNQVPNDVPPLALVRKLKRFGVDIDQSEGRQVAASAIERALMEHNNVKGSEVEGSGVDDSEIEDQEMDSSDVDGSNVEELELGHDDARFGLIDLMG